MRSLGPIDPAADLSLFAATAKVVLNDVYEKIGEDVS